MNALACVRSLCWRHNQNCAYENPASGTTSATGDARANGPIGRQCLESLAEMQLYIPEAARLDGVYQPRHFLMQAEFFAPEGVSVIDSLAEVVPGDWALLIRAPGAFSLSRQSLDLRDRATQPTVFEEITSAEKRALRAKRGALVIDLGWEMLFAYDDVLEGLIASVEALDVDPRKIFLLHCNFAAGPLLERKWAEKSTLPLIQNVAFPVTLALMNVWQQKNQTQAEVEARLSEARTALAQYARPMRYCFFNGEPRPYRLMILCHLAVRGVLDAGFVSMLGYSKGGPKIGQANSEAERYRNFGRKVGASKDVIEAIDDVLARLPMTLDVNAQEVRQSLEQIAWSSPDPRYYNQSSFGIVADTLFFDENVLFVTEKILKPIINASPFFYFGCAGGVAHLQSWGFQAGGGPFTPDYDQITDGRLRMEALVDAIARACQMPEAQLREAVLAEWPTTAHNYRHFWWGYRDRLAVAFRDSVLGPVAEAAREAA